jgi:hypothetical protein
MSCFAASRARTKSRNASCFGSGTHTTVSVPAWYELANRSASRRSVLTRSPGFDGASDGAITSQAMPIAVSCQYNAYPVGPAS